MFVRVFLGVGQKFFSQPQNIFKLSSPLVKAATATISSSSFHHQSSASVPLLLLLWKQPKRTFSLSTQKSELATATTTEKVTALKKRPAKKKQSDSVAAAGQKGYFPVVAYATAEEYDLERLRASLIKQDLYDVRILPQPPTAGDAAADVSGVPEAVDYIYATAKIQFGDEPRDIFIFREGSVVLWNCPELECGNILSHLRSFEIDSYGRALIQEESDCMAYKYDDRRPMAHLTNGNFYLSKDVDDSKANNVALEKYTFSNAMSASVKLGIWEASLDRYVDSMAYVTEDLKRGTKIKMSRADVLRKTGELFALRHLINLSSDLLDTPDFYWDREQLEQLYSSTCSYFSIQRRTKVCDFNLSVRLI